MEIDEQGVERGADVPRYPQNLRQQSTYHVTRRKQRNLDYFVH
jgi:hypothetical protein